MKAITLWQPWASAIMAGLKTVETRSWSTRYRGQLVIHAGTRRPTKREVQHLREQCTQEQWDRLDFDDLPFGAALGVVDLVDCVPIRTTPGYPPGYFADTTWHMTKGSRWPLTDLERAWGWFADDRYAWCLGPPLVFDAPAEMRGKQRLWEIDPVELLMAIS